MNLTPTEAKQFRAPRLTIAEENALGALCNVNVNRLFDMVSKTKPWTDEERASVYKLLEATHALVVERGPRWKLCTYELTEWIQGPRGERIYLDHGAQIDRRYVDAVLAYLNKADPCS